MKKLTTAFLLIFLALLGFGQIPNDIILKHKVDSLLKLMTLEEKIGQMNQCNANGDPTGPVISDTSTIDDIKNGRVGSLLNCQGISSARKYQKLAVDNSRLHIPMIFGLDIIHGYKTIFPIPLASSCSWDLSIIENAERVAATEASTEGINWTFAPMVDISRDPRWGRVMEGAGEDPWLGGQIAAARVRGFQGKKLDGENSLVACVKHFAGYGAPDAGREYNTADMSELKFRNYYMLPYQAAVKAGAGTVMSSFTDIFDTPATCSDFLLKKLLKDDWGFNGFVVSDWGSVGDVINHGVAKDRKQAAQLCVNAGLDMDMVSLCYKDHLTNLIKEGTIPMKAIDDAVRRILLIKFKTGLFDDPFRKMNEAKNKKVILCNDHLKIARETASRSVVLLKNEKQLLPLSKNIKSLALIGPLADSPADMLGYWAAMGKAEDCVSILQGLKNKTNGTVKINYAKGCSVNDNNKEGFAQAIEAAYNSEVVLLAMGESADMSGENNSRAFLEVPGVQKDLMREIIKTGKPIVLLLSNGRPLCINFEKENIPAILECWFLGVQAGNAIADVIFGDYNPSGKLTMTFPLTVGQVPVYYNEKNTGKPYASGCYWCTRYRDIPDEPLYPFGYGLSYTTFEYSKLHLKDTIMSENDTLMVTLNVKNTGKYTGEEVVQLYIRDIVASIPRPLKELKNFKKIRLIPGQEQNVTFGLTVNDLSFWNKELKFGAEPGEFTVMVGPNSQSTVSEKFYLTMAKNNLQ